ncbi:MAG: protein phosphatase CheZ [Alphaproteobacteria bacterium]
MPRQEPVRKFSAERQDRLRRSGAKSVNGRLDVSPADLLTAIQDVQDDVASLRSEIEASDQAGSDETREGMEVRLEIAQMVRIITQAKQEIASIKHPMSDDDRMLSAANELDAIVLATETSTNDVLAAAEVIENLVRTISGRFPDDEEVATTTELVADEIIKIFEACSFQDITGQRTTKVIKTIKFIEERILSMIDIWGIDAFAELPVPQKDADSGDKALMNGPQLSGMGISQDDINAMFD